MQTLNILENTTPSFNAINVLTNSIGSSNNSKSSLLEQLQTTLSLDKLLDIFAMEAARYIKFSGLYFKNKVVQTRYKHLALGLLKSLIASLCALTIPATLLILPILNLSEVLNTPLDFMDWLYKTPDKSYFKEWLLIPIGLLMLPCWIIGLILVRHPITEETLFKKVIYYKFGETHANKA